MARPFVVSADDLTRVPFLRGILTRSLQKAGLDFEASYRVASAVRDELASVDEIDSDDLRALVIEHLEGYGEDIVGRYQLPLPPAETILVESPDHGPVAFSRGRHSQDLLAAGLTSEEASIVSDRIYVELLSQRKTRLSSDELRASTYDFIEAELGEAAAGRYNVWQEFKESDRPLILLIGGAVGCGKSTVATELAHRLQIVRTQSSDMLREVMRTMIHPRLLPILHESTYRAWTGLPPEEGKRKGRPRDDDVATELLIRGYQSQSDLVSVASDAVLRRAIRERVSLIVEGVHVQPGFARRIPEDSDAIVVHVTLAVLKKKRLKERIRGRGRQAPGRRAERYLQNFDAIWEIQSALLDQADRMGVPIVDNRELEGTVHEIVCVILDTLSSQFEGLASESHR